MGNIRHALAFSISERYVLIAISLLGNVIIARLLTPEEIGLYSVSLAVIGIAQVLRDFGMGGYLIQEKDLRDEHVRTVFGFSLLIGSTLFLIVFFSAPIVSEFYNEISMVEVLRISSLNFFVLPFCTISLSLLRRSLIFNRLAVVAVSAAIVGFTVTVGLAWNGFGAKSMAIGAVVTNIVTGAGAWFAREDRRLLMPGFSEWRSVLRFGSQTSAAAVVTTISMDINDLVVGRILGMGPVAMISRAQGLMYLFHRDLMGAIRSVAYPSFAQIHRANLDLDSAHTYAVTATSAFAWPFYAFVALFSLEILRFLFGDQWDQAASLVPWFCLAGAVSVSSAFVIPILTAQGRIDLATRIDLVLQPIRAVILVGGVVFFKTILSFAIFSAIVAILACPYFYYIKGKTLPNQFAPLIQGFWKSIQLTIISVASSISFLSIFNQIYPLNDTARLFIGGVILAFTWVFSIFLIRHPIADDPITIRLLGMLRITRRKI